MVELLIFLALFGWAVVSVVLWLAELPAFPTLLARAVFIPPIAAVSYHRLLRRNGLDFLRTKRGFLPPERFYWPERAAGLRRSGLWLVAVAAGSWPVAIGCPARLSADAISILGWVSGWMGIVAGALACARLWLYVKGSQRFDRFTPGFIGAIRRFMYWISDNHEFLGEEPEMPRKATKESVY